MTQHCENCHAILERVEALLAALDSPAARRAAPILADNEEAREFADTLIQDPQSRITVSLLYSAYLKWCRSRGTVAMGKKRLGIALESLGFPACAGNQNVRMRRGLRLA